MSWTEERVEKLKRLWAEGKSASQIAKELGGVTRNAVIGKVHRLGLSNRNKDAAKPAPAAEEPAKAAPAAAEAPAEPPAEPAPTEPEAAAPASEPEAPASQDEVPVVATGPVPPRRPVGQPGQPLPPQPSTSEISPDALARMREAEKRARKLSLMELTERTCKWPIGDPATEEFWFCGLPAEPGKPYCEAHVAVAYQPMSSRRDRRSGR
ncbi:MAG: GcrA cell cycle regulator [Alphaproteobacteria bacterium]|nr:MAG: GcrA cell cycle regulator [Alphaproteobacteria bacterium]